MINAVICVCRCCFRCLSIHCIDRLDVSHQLNFGILLVRFVEACQVTCENTKYISDYSYCNEPPLPFFLITSIENQITARNFERKSRLGALFFTF